ncbi:PGAP1-like alpha/beta domain-containing protein [Alloscardovia criceti]|uniref:PGAP1-like alpha/beta domain-containing protein n=1 Tax=Alloscardovia criceti TaxID=356828 RepID=UPI00036AE19E|nr:hypothetical protein [Alloscardovia criceti]
MSTSAFTSARILGGKTSIDDPEEFYALMSQGLTYADALQQSASALLTTSTYASDQLSVVAACPQATQAHHFPYVQRIQHIADACSAHRNAVLLCAQQMYEIADRVIRSLNLYSAAEKESEQALLTLIEMYAAHHPALAGTSMVLWGLAAETQSAHPSLAGALSHHSAAQQSVIRGIARGVAPHGSVSSFADTYSAHAHGVGNLYQGNTLSVQEIAVARPLPAVTNIRDSLRNLDTLTAGQTGNSYGTVAIQRYTQADGSHAWVVTIPGTDGQPDSPFGWPQNLNLMAGEARNRALADSQTAVVQAMTLAGIQPEESVTLVGHSQGGIIAASLASDPQLAYTISHVITAGSPIANHPIDTTRTWVTSVETDREIVSDLDGQDNPQSPHWLTIRGYISQDGLGSQDLPVQKTHAHTPVSGTDASAPTELSHGMNYHLATFDNAQNLHSDALDEHNKHFAQLNAGTLDTNLYFQCRLQR